MIGSDLSGPLKQPYLASSSMEQSAEEGRRRPDARRSTRPCCRMSPAESFEACPSPAARGRGAGGLEGVDPPGSCRCDAEQPGLGDGLRSRPTGDGTHAPDLGRRARDTAVLPLPAQLCAWSRTCWRPVVSSSPPDDQDIGGEVRPPRSHVGSGRNCSRERRHQRSPVRLSHPKYASR